jgi:ATP-binding cassette subfamily B protein/subfamily B ATP-binding cassette protein MsbA
VTTASWTSAPGDQAGENGLARTWRVFVAARPRWGSWALVFGLTLASSAVALATPWPMKVFVDQVAGHTPVTGMLASLPGTASRAGLLVWVVVAEVVVFSFAGALDVVLTNLWVTVGQGMVYRFSSTIFSRVQRRSLAAHQRGGAGDALARVTGDSWVVHTILDGLVFAPLNAVILTVGMLWLMFSLDAPLTFVGLAALPLVGGLAFVLSRPIQAAGRRRRVVESSMQSHVHQTLTGVAVVQAYGMESRQRRRFAELATEDIAAQKQALLAQELNGLGRGLATALVAGAVLWIGANEVLDHRITTGTLLVFVAYLGSLHEQFTTLSGIPSLLQGARASVDRVLEVLDAEPEVLDRPGAAAVGRLAGAVAFDHVSFGYGPDRPVLEDVSFEVAPGETVALVGPTGAGKSTLLGLVLRLHDPWSGAVLVDGTDARDLQLTGLRANVALVLQESFLFPVSVSENITYGRPGAGAGDVEAAARAANAHEFIVGLPDGYDTVLGDRGGTLSGGERQRIAIARAILKDAPVLILDEPTSALDVGTEATVVEALTRLMQGRTTLIIAHRLSTIRHVDRVVVLERGRVVEDGTPDELLARPGAYARMRALADGTVAT